MRELQAELGYVLASFDDWDVIHGRGDGGAGRSRDEPGLE